MAAAPGTTAEGSQLLGEGGVMGASAVAATPGTPYDFADNATNGTKGPWFFDGPYSDLTQLTSVYAVLIILSILVIVVGLTGNSMVIAVVCRHRSMRTPTNFYIVSLALSDFLVTSFVMPLKLLELSADADISILNPALCTVLGFLQPYFVFNSIWTLVAISIDRYLVILHPLRSRSFNTRSRASRNVATIWAMPFLVLAGYFYPHHTINYRMISELGVIRRTTCQSELPLAFQRWYTLFQFSVLLLLPTALLCFTCFSIARRLFRLTEDEKMLKTSLRKEEASRRKVAKMVLVVVFAFVMCWAPFFIVTLVNHFLKILGQSNFFFWQSVLFFLGFSNSCMNPIIYAFMSRAFRRGFRGIIVCFCPCTKACFKHKSKFVNPRRSVTIISSEPNTEACRVSKVGGGGKGGWNKKRRAAGGLDRSSRWNNTQYSTMSETESIDMTRLPGSDSSVNGGPHEHHPARNKTDSFIAKSPPIQTTPAGSHRQGETKTNPRGNSSTQVLGGNPSSFAKSQDNTPFVDVSLDEEPSQNTAPSNPSTDHNQNTPLYPGSKQHQEVISEAEEEEPGCMAPLLTQADDKPRTDDGH